MTDKDLQEKILDDILTALMWMSTLCLLLRERSPDKLSSMALSNNGVVSVNLIPVDSVARPQVLGSGNLPYSKVKDAPWLKEAVDKRGQVVWIPMYSTGLEDKEASFGLARIIKSTSGNKPFVLLIEIKASLISDQLNTVKLGGDSVVRLLDSNNTVLIDSVDPSSVGRKMRLKFPIREIGSKGASGPQHPTVIC